MSAEYKKAHERYRQAVAQQAKPERAKIMNEIRQIERDSAREGKVLSATYKGDQVVVSVTDAPTKRSLQEEYVRKFDDKVKIPLIEGKDPQTLREYHSQRLLRR